MNHKTQNVLICAVILVYYSIIGYMIFSLTGSRKPFLDSFNSFTLIGPLGCKYNTRVSNEMTILDDILIITKVVYLFIG